MVRASHWRCWRRSLSLSLIAATLCVSSLAGAQNESFAGNEHHTNVYSVAAQDTNQIKWSTSIDDRTSGQIAHYGQPLVTANNTVIVIVLNADYSFSIKGFNGSNGSLKWSVNTDYTLPTYGWVPPLQPVVTNGPSGKRLYYQGKGGTLYYIDSIDSNSPSSPTHIAFYGIGNYTAAFDTTVFIDTPLTADSSGNIFFGFRVQNGPAPAPISSSSSGWARIDSNDNGSYVLTTAIVSNSNYTRDSHNVAPALSNDESTVYVIAKSGASNYDAYLCGLNSTTLATKYSVHVSDPRPGGSVAGPIEDSTACPLVAPDGDVYMGMFVSPYNGSRGYLAHYSGDLSTVKTPGAFGWDYTPGIVPASMVPSYHGSSSYLLFCKYNNYTGTGQDDGGDGVNTLAVLDPNDETQTDWHPQAAGMTEMREVMTVIGNTPDSENPSITYATREWCVNATAVNPATGCIFFNSEDGNTYRWNLAQNSLNETLNLTTGFGEPYVPQSIGPDGTVYTFNGTYVFAMGQTPGVTMTVDSSVPDNKTVVVGDSLTFTANVGGGAQQPTGTVTFTDNYYDDRTPMSTVLASNVPLVNGHASVTTSALVANLDSGNTLFGNHFITATYSGDGNHSPTSITRVQKVHSNASSVDLQASSSYVNVGDNVMLTATVTGVGSSNVPKAYVTFRAGNTVLGQVHTDGSGIAILNTTDIPAGDQTISAEFVGDTQYAASTDTTPVSVQGAASLNASPATFLSGNTSTGTVTISAMAPVGGQTVNLSSSDPAITVPSQVTVLQGQTSVNFTINGTNSTYNNISSTLTATLGGQVTKVVTVEPNNRSTFISQSAPTTMVCGQSYPVSLQFKNTGSVTWDTAHTYQIGSAIPYNNTNFGMNRIPLTSGPVAPGATGTFSATVIGPSTPGTYNFQWQMYQQTNNMFFGQASTGISVVVTANADAARYISRTGATTVAAGASFFVQNTFKNVGTNSWSTGSGYSMMTVNPNNNTIWTTTRGYLSSGTIAPGANGTFTGSCTAPTSPGVYTMQWQMDKNGVPFGDTSPLLNITVTGSSADNATYVSETQVPTSVATGVTFGVTFTMHNTGSTTWSGSYVLASIGSSNFGVASINPTSSVAPGTDGTFTTTFTAPASPGTYTFQQRMSHGATQFGVPTPGLSITVTSGDAAEYISRTGTLTIAAGRDFYIQNTMKNTGTTSWSTATQYSMMTVNPLNDPTWTATRAYLASGTITPGSSGTFNANCTAPIIAGAYYMQWQMDKSGVPFGETTPQLCIFVYQGPDDAQFISQSGIPSTIAHGATFTPTITMKNVGTGTWSASYSLASIGSNTFGVASIPSTTVGPNGTKAFSTTFTAPNTPGTYTFKMRMQNGSTKFGQASTQVTITVT